MFVAEGAFINEFVLGFWYYLAPLKDLSFLSRSPFSLLLLSVLSPRGLGRELPSRDSRMCCSTWREFPNRVTGKVIVSFIVSFVAVLVWRHAVCISHGTDSACSGHPLRVSSRFAVAVEPPLRDGVTRPRGLRAIWREHLQCWSEMAPLDIGVALGGSGARMFFVGKYGLSAVFVSLLSLQVEVRCRRSSLRSAASSCNTASPKLSGRFLCDVYACKELYVASRSFAGTRHFSPEQHESVTFASAKKAVRHVAPSNGTEFRSYTTLLSRAT